jgi:hypothetical protein
MSRVVKLSVLTIVVLFVGAIVASQAQARPNYCKEFIGQYENVKEAKEAKCTICHPGKEKKERNIYGVALSKCLAAEKVTDEAKIKESLKKVEGEKSAVAGKTFGDLLKDGKLPASK